MLTKEYIDNVAIINFEGEFTIHEVKKVRELMKEIEELEIFNVIFNLSQVKYIDSSAIGLLVTVLKNVKKNNGWLKLYSPTDEIKRTLKLVNLVSFFEITDKLK